MCQPKGLAGSSVMPLVTIVHAGDTGLEIVPVLLGIPLSDSAEHSCYAQHSDNVASPGCVRPLP